MSRNVQRDDDLSLPLNDDVMRDAGDEFEQEFEEWKNHLGPMFQARLLSVCATLFEGQKGKEFYEATLYEAFCWIKEIKS